VSVALLKYWRQVEVAALRKPATAVPRPQAAVVQPVEVIPRRWIVVWFPGGAKRMRIDSTQLAMILGGVRLESVRRRTRFSPAS
jgi:hypothetical protein